MASGRLHVGTSGYQYNHWRGHFYPDKLPKRAWFDHYARHFDALEVNATFYNLPKAATVDDWAAQAPAGFRYVPKFSRFGSHMKKLKDPDASVPPFVDAVRRLGNTLGPVLVQLPGNWRVDTGRLQNFLEVLPGDVRWAFEFRDASWLCDDVFALLERHGAALVIHDLLPDHPDRPTADFEYRRYHGGEGHDRGYNPQYLVACARQIRAGLAAGRDVYAFFNNDISAHAPDNAARLKRYLV